MPANDFAPSNAAAVDISKVYLIKGATLKKLLVEVRCDPSQFDVKETPSERIYSYRAPNANSLAGGISGSYSWSFLDNVNSYASELELTFENGILVGSTGISQTGAGTIVNPFLGQFFAYNSHPS